MKKKTSKKKTLNEELRRLLKLIHMNSTEDIGTEAEGPDVEEAYINRFGYIAQLSEQALKLVPEETDAVD